MPMKQRLRLAFTDFWEGFDCNPTGKSCFDNVLYKILSERFDIDISDDPDFLIYSVFGSQHKHYTCPKVFYTAENVRPDFNECQYAITFDYLDDARHLRFPLSAVTLYEWGILDDFAISIDCERIRAEKTRFCNFLFSNANARERNTLFQKLSKYKRVDSGGRALNNLGYYVEDKMNFLSQYKFTIAFENSEYSGYTTEKLVHPKLVNSIPIYWGNPDVHKDWNTHAFINAYEFPNMKQLIEFIQEVDRNDNLYFNLLRQPHFTTPKSRHLDRQTLITFFERITHS